MTQALRVRCSARSKGTGEQCKLWAIRGATVCRSHGGGARQVRAKAALRADIFDWGLTDITEDPGEVHLRLVTQSARRAQRYAEELEELVENSPSLREALVADVWLQPERGDAYKSGEYIRGLARLEAEERDRCANFASKAIAAGLAERQVRLAERQGELMLTMLMESVVAAGLNESQATALKVALAQRVRALGTG